MTAAAIKSSLSAGADRTTVPFGSTIAEGRTRLLLFRIAGGFVVPLAELTPAARLAFSIHGPESMGARIDRGMQRSWRASLIAILPLGVLAISSAVGAPGTAPGWITWVLAR